jgi:large subunit ribosomal protein L29
MVILRVGEIRKMGKEERGKKITELRTELSRLMTMRAMGGSMENPARIRLIRKTIAKFNTISREEELGMKRQPSDKKKPKEKEPEPLKGKAAKEKPKKEKKPTEKAKKEPEAEETVDEEEED